MLSAEVYSNDQRVGTISLGDDDRLVLNPPDDETLLNIAQLPVFVPLGDELVAVYADTDPVLFMSYLPAHYKSQGLLVGEVTGDEGAYDDQDEEDAT